MPTNRIPQRARRQLLLTVAAGCATPALWRSAWAQGAETLPVTPQQRATAQQVARQGGVPLGELAPGAPDSHVVRRGDTLWDISARFLRSPWRWPELWGMNREQIRNPHLIYPGQVLVLEKIDGRARLRVGQWRDGSGGTVKLSPRVRAEPYLGDQIAAVPMHLLAPFLNEAIVMESNALEAAPRIVAVQEGRVMLTRGDTAYVVGDLQDIRDWRVFRQAVPLHDPLTKELLGYEARYLGVAEYVRQGGLIPAADGKEALLMPASIVLREVREEVSAGDRLARMPAREFVDYAPHAPATAIDGRVVSIYGDALSAGQNQIVSINKGASDGIERGHVLALWRAGATVVDKTDPKRQLLQLPDERDGVMFVFRTFERVSYALVLQARQPIRIGDRFTQPD